MKEFHVSCFYILDDNKEQSTVFLDLRPSPSSIDVRYN